MDKFFTDLLMAVITAAIPVISAFAIRLINRTRDKATAETESIRKQYYINEISDAVSNAVAATSQTYVDALKKAGSFDKEKQKEAAQKALNACLASLSAEAVSFIEDAYGDSIRYLTDKIEAEVRKQKNEMIMTGILETAAGNN